MATIITVQAKRNRTIPSMPLIAIPSMESRALPMPCIEAAS
jgi:hypothetical protein